MTSERHTMPMKSCTTPSISADSWRAPSGVRMGAGRAGAPSSWGGSSSSSPSSKAEELRLNPPWDASTEALPAPASSVLAEARRSKRVVHALVMTP